MAIIYEGFFVNGDNKLNKWLCDNFVEDIKEQGRKYVDPKFYHITTEFRPYTTHEKWYGEKVKVLLSFYKPYSAIEHAEIGEKVMVEAFKVQDIITSNNELKSYIDIIKKKFHITISYSGKPVDSNYIDWDKECKQAGISLCMVYGGYNDKGEIIIRK